MHMQAPRKLLWMANFVVTVIKKKYTAIVVVDLTHVVASHVQRDKLAKLTEAIKTVCSHTNINI
jgi:hypothetical protein